VPEVLGSAVTSLHNDNPESAYLGALKTSTLPSQDLYWPAMEAVIQKYVAGCDLCNRINAPCHTLDGLNRPLAPHSHPCDGLTMDFVTHLLESTALGYTGILVIVNHMSNIATYLPCRKDIDSPELARLYF